MIMSRLKSTEITNNLIDNLYENVSHDMVTFTSLALKVSYKPKKFPQTVPSDNYEAVVASPAINLGKFFDGVELMLKYHENEELPQEIHDRCLTILENANPKSLERLCRVLDKMNGNRKFELQVAICRRFLQLMEAPWICNNLYHVLKLQW